MRHDARPVQDLYRSIGAPPPDFTFDPVTATPAPCGFTLAWWRDHAAGGVVPPPSVIDPFALKPALSHIVILEPMPDGDFRYRLYGTVVAQMSGADLTGKRVSDHIASIHVAEFLLAIYRASAGMRRPILATRRPMGAEFVALWTSLVLPFATASGEVTRVMTVPVATDSGGTMLLR